jgi:hypothetical protein
VASSGKKNALRMKTSNKILGFGGWKKARKIYAFLLSLAQALPNTPMYKLT